MSKVSIFYKRVRELCEDQNMTVNELVKKLKLSSGSPTAWKNGTIPRAVTVQKIADFFHVSTDYLLGNVSDPFFHLDNQRILADINSYESEEKTPTKAGERTVDLSEVDFAFYGDYKELSEAEQETLRDMVRIMRERRASRQEK